MNNKMMLEWDYYIPPDAAVSDAGVIADYSEVYRFDNRVDKFLKSFSGWGMPPISYITQRGPFQHGETALDYRLQPRLIQMAHRRLAGCRTEYWDNRYDLIDFLRPNRQTVNSFEPGRLRKVLPDGTTRDIFVYLDKGPVFNYNSSNSSWDMYAIDEVIRFVAFDPIVFDPTLNNASWTLGSTDNLIFYESPDWTNRLVFVGDDLDSGGIWFGEGSIGDSLDVTYNGTWLAYPTIIITGPLDIPRIFNNTTDEKIQLDYDVSVGETVTINLDYGVKTIINNFGTNLIGTASTDSDIATFHIAPHPEAVNGVNELAVFGGDATIGVTEVRITYNERYIGI